MSIVYNKPKYHMQRKDMINPDLLFEILNSWFDFFF